MIKISLKNLLQKVNKKFDLNLTLAKQREIITDLTIAGVENELSGKGIGEAVNLILSRVNKEKEKVYSPLVASIQAANAQDLTTCPLCHQKMQKIELVGKRVGYYCDTHRVCLPVPSETN